MSEVAEFWAWVARERAALEQAERPTVADVVAWLEAEKRLQELEEKAKFMKQFEGGGEYYEGFLEALKEVRA